jgi:P27 family predicted phage terminase small subunit
MPQPPNWLTDTAKKRWGVLYPTLDKNRVRDGALDTLAQYCQTYSDWRDAVEQLQKGVVLKDGLGRIVENPYVKVRDSALKNMAELGKALGIRPDTLLVPVTRWEEVATVIGVDDSDEHDDE